MKILKQSHSAEKPEWGDPFEISNIHFVAKYQETRRDPMETLKIFEKSRTVPEKLKGGTL